MSSTRVVHPQAGTPLPDPIQAVLRGQCAAWETLRQDDAPSGLGTVHPLTPRAAVDRAAPFDWAISAPELGDR